MPKRLLFTLLCCPYKSLVETYESSYRPSYPIAPPWTLTTMEGPTMAVAMFLLPNSLPPNGLRQSTIVLRFRRRSVGIRHPTMTDVVLNVHKSSLVIYTGTCHSGTTAKEMGMYRIYVDKMNTILTTVILDSNNINVTVHRCCCCFYDNFCRRSRICVF